MKVPSNTFSLTARVLAAGGLTLGVLLPSAVAYADSSCYTGCNPTNVQPATSVKAESVSSSSSLPFTGGDVAAVAGVGAGALLAGSVMVRRSRRAAVERS